MFDLLFVMVGSYSLQMLQLFHDTHPDETLLILFPASLPLLKFY